MENILERAKKINNLNPYLPEVSIGEIVEINDIWDGDGELPESSYTYTLTHDGEDGQSNCDIFLNYEFEVIEEKKNQLDTKIKITNIQLL